jgi:hypothetical protein
VAFMAYTGMSLCLPSSVRGLRQLLSRTFDYYSTLEAQQTPPLLDAVVEMVLGTA